MNDWISVKDRLPEIEAYVLVHYENEKIKPIDIGYYSLAAKMWNVGYIKTGIVTHWMPLPAPPEGEE